MQRMLKKAEHLLGDSVNAKAIQLVAKELLAKETISGRAVRQLFSEASSD